jgi:SAM-dependent methyltransferase
VNGGIARLVPTDLHETLAAQQDAWRRLEKARGRYEVPWEVVLGLPEDPRVRSSLEWLRAVLKNRGPCRVLELGAGRGWATRALADDGHRVVASDLSDDPHIGLGCAMRRRHETGKPFACVLTPAETLPFRPASFDCVFCFATLRHIVDLERVFTEAARVLRPGGFFVALQEPFRGVLTSQVQWFQDSVLYRAARGWIVGKLPDRTSPQLLKVRASVGATVYDLCRRVPFCVAAGAAAGLDTTILPAPVLHSIPPNLKLSPAVHNGGAPEWLDGMAVAYGLDVARFRATIEQAQRSMELELIPALLAHWTLVNNCDGFLIGIRNGEQRFVEPQPCRQLDPLFLASAPQGLLPVYGIYAEEGPRDDRYFWTQPQAGFLVPGTSSVEMTITCPTRYFRSESIRVEFRIEGERTPVSVFSVLPGKTVTLKVPIPKPMADRPSLLLRLTANLGFLPSDFDPRIRDTRLLALQLRHVRARQVSADGVQVLLQEIRDNR